MIALALATAEFSEKMRRLSDHFREREPFQNAVQFVITTTVVIVCLCVARKAYLAIRQSPSRDQSRCLFRKLCRALPLRFEQRRLLARMVAGSANSQPAAFCISERHFDRAVGEWRAKRLPSAQESSRLREDQMIAGLRQLLFGDQELEADHAGS